jgi:hypothetical protein
MELLVCNQHDMGLLVCNQHDIDAPSENQLIVFYKYVVYGQRG